MLVAILVLIVFQTLFIMACAGHLAKIEKYQELLLQAKQTELKIWSGNGNNN